MTAISSAQTPSEAFVAKLCQRSFLKLWTHPNPLGKKNKELCDCLVVCGEHIVIVSVKEIAYKDTGDATGWERWTRAAIEESAKQIAGAERFLESIIEVTRSDGRVIQLPPKEQRTYHRIAVALGGGGEVPLKWGDLGNGFVHVCAETGLEVLFNVLDTIADFVKFMSESEALVRGGITLILNGGGLEDLVALYWSNGQTFQGGRFLGRKPNLVVLDDDLWRGTAKSRGFAAFLAERRASYFWDRMIELFAGDLLTDGMFDMHSQQVTKNELALITMALQPRAYRLVLSESWAEFLQKPELSIAARVAQGADGVAFIFTTGPSSDREHRVKELLLRCWVVRGRLPGVRTVVGIAIDRPGSGAGFAADIVYLDIPDWDDESETMVVGIQRDCGFFSNAQWAHRAKDRS